MASRSTSYYKKNPKALAKKRKYNREYSKRTKGSKATGPKKKALKKADAERWAERKKRGIAGKGGADMSHKRNGKMVAEAASKNRARNGKNGKSTKKA